MPYSNHNIWYDITGEGNAVLLIHGYLETSQIWDDLITMLAGNFKLIRIDLPGHGQTNYDADIITPDNIAILINDILTDEQINKIFVIGHSLGGYVAQAYLSLFPFKTSGICLFHSTPLADNDTKKTLRDKEIYLIQKGKLNLIAEIAITNSFTEESKVTYHDHILRIKKNAKFQPKGIIAILEGMKRRPDRQFLLKQTNIPILFFLGKKDTSMDVELIENIAKRGQSTEVIILNNSAHMGFIEEKDKCLTILLSFLHQHTKA